MSDTTEQPEAPATDQPAVEAPAQELDWKAEARKWETRAKENASAAKKLAQLEESQKSELQKAMERAEQAEARINQYETERQLAAWRSEVATASGVPADALRGSTREELEAHAEVLSSLISTRRGPVVPNPGDTPQNKAEADELATVRSLFGN